MEDMSAQSQPCGAREPISRAAPEAEPSAALCSCCYRTADMEPVEVKRDGKWVASTIRRCTNPECHSVREGSLADRVAHINSVYGYKYFGDYELSPEQLDAVGEAVMLANRVPELLRVAELLWPNNLSQVPDHLADDFVFPVDVTAGELRALQAAISKAEGRDTDQ
jgi:hypothetical protein